jgi:hypothetical protein
MDRPGYGSSDHESRTYTIYATLEVAEIGNFLYENHARESHSGLNVKTSDGTFDDDFSHEGQACPRRYRMG